MVNFLININIYIYIILIKKYVLLKKKINYIISYSYLWCNEITDCA